jgi:DNA invertase Pin-like site-specific DNA recombinase
VLFQPEPAEERDLAEFERAMIQERIRDGLARVKAKSKKLGRRPVPQKTEDRIREVPATGAGIIKMAREVGVGVGTVQRIAVATRAGAAL